MTRVAVLGSESAMPVTSGCDVTILMPCLNERITLPACIDTAEEAVRQLEAQGLSAEILVSDNGSEDGSREYAMSRGCRVTECPQRGYGAALIHGIHAARGRYVVMGDSDASYDFREGVPMVGKLTEGYDICMGNRFTGKIVPGEIMAEEAVRRGRRHLQRLADAAEDHVAGGEAVAFHARGPGRRAQPLRKLRGGAAGRSRDSSQGRTPGGLSAFTSGSVRRKAQPAAAKSQGRDATATNALCPSRSQPPGDERTALRRLCRRWWWRSIRTGQASLHAPQSELAAERWFQSARPRRWGVITEPIGP